MDGQLPTTADQIDNIPPKVIRHKLSVPVVASYLFKGYSQADIGRIHNVSRQAVDNYIDIHQDEIADIIGYDEIMPFMLKHNNLRIERSVDDEDIKKAGLVGKRTAIGIGIDKHRELEGKRADNFLYESISIKIDDRSIEIQRLKKLLNVGEDSQNMTDITPVNDDVLPPVMGDNDHS